ncbi:hypothetical protein CK203_071276 [Vitis vinifera]|uniref:DUF7796 domain-containing protein n=1 Tax=Vitis vinifera TaxID=29760 RepID=A0A438ET32_VITVI|nr:hypothetical protein CK203_071276 [Vitis vinifera]
MVKSPKRLITMRLVSDLDWRILLLIVPCFSLLIFFSISSAATAATLNTISSFAPLKVPARDRAKKEELNGSRIAVCLVGGARRFELTGPSIMEKILNEYPNSDLFLHSPLDLNAFKFSLLKTAPRIAAIRIFQPKPIPETEPQLRVLTARNSPNGIQGLLQYFNLVEGCLTMIKAYQKDKNFTYDWIVRTRVDGYWNAPLGPEYFVPGKYVVPAGSNYGGLNDRFGVGDLNTSTGTAHHQGIPHLTKRIPFCVVSDRRYEFPPARFGVPVAAMSSPGPLSGAKCRPCEPVCQGPCVADVIGSLIKGWSWTDWANGSLQLCDAHGEWEKGWEKRFDRVAGSKLARARKRVGALRLKDCVKDFEEMRNRTSNWDAPTASEICKLGL